MKTITVYDIAKEANVSVATVSRVLNNTAPVKRSTRERIEEIMNRHQFQPNALARSLVKKETGMIGIILPDITNPFFPEVISGLEMEARNKGYTFFLCDTVSANRDSDEQYERESQYLNLLMEKQVDGIVMIGGRINLARCDKAMVDEVTEASKRIPIVLINGSLPGAGLHRVAADERRGAALATQHLIDLGHRDIAFIGGYRQMSNTVQRVEGFVKTMEQEGIPVRKDLIRYGGFSVDTGKQLTDDLIGRPDRPTALFCANDLIAIGALKSAHKAGLRVPEDLSVIGFDDIPFASNSIPELTTISLQTVETGRLAVEIMHKLIGKRQAPKLTAVKPELIVRESTGPAPAHRRVSFEIDN